MIIKSTDILNKSQANPKDEYRTKQYQLTSILSLFSIFLTYFWYQNLDKSPFKFSLNEGIQIYSSLLGLYCQALALFALLLAARLKYIERYLGLDRLLIYHRWSGELLILTMILHICGEIIASRQFGYLTTIKNYSSVLPYFAMATIGSLIYLTIGITSLKKIRRRFQYETWYFLHLTSYLAIFLTFFHEINSGVDFIQNKISYWAWIILNLSVFLLIIYKRLFSTIRSFVKPFTIVDIIPHGNSAAEVIMKGRALKGDHGQFAIFRFWGKDLFWQAHPFSLGNSPESGYLRLTMRRLGDGTDSILDSIKVGGKVSVEGPYGAITNKFIGSKPVLLIAGGVGVVPILSLLQSLTKENNPQVIYRSSKLSESPHLEEIANLVKNNNGKLNALIGSRDTLSVDPFSPKGLLQLVPDLIDREVILCGPELMIDRTVISLLKNGVPIKNIHHERLWW